MSRNVFSANLWFLFDFGPAEERYNSFLANGVPAFKMLIESLLLHDQIVIPTQDFMVLQLLRSQFSEPELFEMLETGCVRFLRFNGLLAYSGGGKLGSGIQPFAIYRAGDIELRGKPDESNGVPFCAPIESAIEWAMSSNKKKPRDTKLSRLVLDRTDEITAKSVVEQVRDETYMDVLHSQYLRDLFGLRHRDIGNLVGLRQGEIRCVQRHHSGTWMGDEIDVVLALAQTNLELYLAGSSGCVDSSTASPVGQLIKAKAQRTFGDKNVFKDFSTLKEIEDIPDLGEGVLRKTIPLKRLLKLRQSANGEQFRKWFHDNCRKNPVDTAKEYVSLLHEVPKVQSLPIRILRFIVTSLLPGPLAPIAGGIDSFVVDRLLRGSSAKYFIEEIRQLHEKPGWRKS